jgi:hypothetical protein
MKVLRLPGMVGILAMVDPIFAILSNHFSNKHEKLMIGTLEFFLVKMIGQCVITALLLKSLRQLRPST